MLEAVLGVGCWVLGVACCVLRVACCVLLRVACCVLRVACCVLRGRLSIVYYGSEIHEIFKLYISSQKDQEASPFHSKSEEMVIWFV